MTYIYLETIDSTNNELKRRLNSGDLPEEFTVVSAGMQTAGRGRTGHEWSSPSGVSVATSMVCYPTLSDERIPQLTIVAAVAVARSVEKTFDQKAQIKWPNDLLLCEKKICGILTERIGKAVIVGIGVNMKRGSYLASLSDRATSIEEQLLQDRTARIGNPLHPNRAAHIGEQLLQNHSDSFESFFADAKITPSDRSKKENNDPWSFFVQAIWDEFYSLYTTFLESDTLDFLLKEYNHRLINAGRTVKILAPKDPFLAIAKEMDENGRLVVVRTDSGEECTVDSGEVQVRGITGYV